MDNIVKQARTIRWFKKDKIDLKLIEDTLDTTRYTAQTKNVQEIRYVIVNDNKDLKEEIFTNTNLSMTHKVPKDEQPAGYILFTHKDKVRSKDGHLLNMGVKFQTINLLLESKGIRCVFVHVIDKVKIKKSLNLDENVNIDCLIAYGKANREVKVVDTTNEEDQSYFKDENGVHSVPKLTLDTLIISKQ